VPRKKTTASKKRITVKIAKLNEKVRSVRISEGTTLEKLAEKLECSVSDLIVNGEKKKGDYILKTKDFVIQTTNIKGA